MIASSPEALVSEGVAQLALEAALGPEPYEVAADVLADIDLRFDPVEAHEIHGAELELYAAATNAAFMIHEEGMPDEEVAAYLRRWANPTRRPLVPSASSPIRPLAPTSPPIRKAGGCAATSRIALPGTSHGC